jgi:hypothetical protein
VIPSATTVIPKSMLGKDDPLLRVRSKAASGRPEEESDTVRQLLPEVFHRKASFCHLLQVTVPINSNDKLYAEIRSMNVVAVGQLLQTRSRDLMAKEAVSPVAILQSLRFTPFAFRACAVRTATL